MSSTPEKTDRRTDLLARFQAASGKIYSRQQLSTEVLVAELRATRPLSVIRRESIEQLRTSMSSLWGRTAVRPYPPFNNTMIIK